MHEIGFVTALVTSWSLLGQVLRLGRGRAHTLHEMRETQKSRTT